MADVEKAELTQSPQEGSNQPTAPPYTDDPPPSYESVVGRIKDVRANSKNKQDMARKLSVMLFCNSVSMTLTIALCIAVPVINIIIGALFIDKCPLERMIPIYLIVGGSFVLFRAVLNIAELIQKRQSAELEQQYERSRLYTCCDFPISFFLFIWFIAGNVWIFGNREYFQHTDPSLGTYCDPTLYWYAFWITIVAWVMMLAPLVLCCCVSCITCCGLWGEEPK